MAGACAGGVVVLVAVFVVWEALPALSRIDVRRLATDDGWHPTSGQFNMLPMVVGSLAAAIGSLFLTLPLGIGAAVFSSFYAPPWVAAIFRRSIEILAGIPSVVFGLWGITCLVPLITEMSPLGQGQSLLAGVLVLSVMTLPTIALATEAALSRVPDEQIHAAIGLGLGRRAVIWSVAIPNARTGIMTGVVLQLGRAIGETMAVLMVCGNIVQMPSSVFQPVRMLTVNIALEMGYADPAHRSLLFVGGLLLLVMVALLMWISDLFGKVR